MKQEIFGLPLEKLQTLLAELGMKRFRAAQVYDWLYRKSVFDFAAMTNLGKAEREQLAASFTVLPREIEVLRRLDSSDGLTSKLLLRLTDGNTIETVLMHHDYGYSVCVSSQAGCDMHCAFCASGLHGAVRNLTLAEIVAQVYFFNASLFPEGERVSRVVVMGSGEPMLNFDNVFGALQFLHRPDTANMSYRNMTVSTCGIIPGIERMTRLGLPVNLAVSLHAVRPELRTELMPVNRGYPFPAVLQAAEAYAVSSGRQVTYEYILLAGKNDSETDARLLAEYMRYKHASVNLIPVNPVPEKGFFRPSQHQIDRFLHTLERNHVSATVRKEMGQDINAACGQLRAAYAKQEEPTCL
ncbi:MAG: putative dual-specificity RNA methyltransferase RlmN [Succiniclasticum sp.]|jgi:23S rRNA (adenine2503-C2)-methyltransferase